MYIDRGKHDEERDQSILQCKGCIRLMNNNIITRRRRCNILFSLWFRSAYRGNVGNLHRHNHIISIYGQYIICMYII
jgi:hypothetical protein